MTYKEIKDRLSKCELTLEKIKSGKITDLKPADLKKKTAQLEVLRESYIKQLKEAEEKTYLVTPKSGKTAALSLGDDEVDALKDADDIDKIKSSDGTEVKEQEGVKFSVDETKAIARSVGKAVAMSLKTLGDEIDHMKAKNIEENSFEIYVQYKNERDDEFAFYIVEDTLHLTDFSFDKELTDVGVKPSGEAVVNIDVLANELTKHFKSLNEDEEEDARNDADYERGWHDDPRADEALKEAPEGMYYIKIPKDAASQNKAQVIFNDLYGIKYELNDDPNGVIMYFKKEDFDSGILDDLEGEGVQILDTNIEESVKEGEVDQEADRGDLDVGHQDDEPNMLKKDLYDVITYASKLYKALDKYDQHDGEVDFPHWWQKKVTLARDYMSAAQHYLEGEEKLPAIDQLALENVDKVAGGIPYKREGNKFIITEPLDDATKERIMKRAKEHGHQAAPNQAGGVTIIAKEGVKEKETVKEDWGSSDQNIFNQSIHKALGEPKSMPSPFSQELESAAEDAVDHYWDDWEEYDTDREGLVEHAKKAYLRAYFKETFNKMVQMFSESMNEEMDENRFLAASMEDLEQVIRNLAHTGEMSEDEAIEMAIRKLEAMLDGRDDMDEGLAKTQKAHGLVVAKMKELAKQYKAGDKSVVAQLKDLTAKKKQLEKQLEKDVAGKNRGQQLDTSINEYRGVGDDLVKIIKDKAEDSGFSHEEETEEIIEFLQGIEFDDNGNIDAVYEEYKGKHQGSNYQWPMSQATKDRKEADKAAQAAKKKSLKEEKSTCCGKCGRKHVKGTKCKTPYLKGKDHCRTR